MHFRPTEKKARNEWDMSSGYEVGADLLGQSLHMPPQAFKSVSGHDSVSLRHLQQGCGICLISRRSVVKIERQDDCENLSKPD